MSDNDFLKRIEKTYGDYRGEAWSPEKTIELFSFMMRRPALLRWSSLMKKWRMPTQAICVATQSSAHCTPMLIGFTSSC